MIPKFKRNQPTDDINVDNVTRKKLKKRNVLKEWKRISLNITKSEREKNEIIQQNDQPLAPFLGISNYDTLQHALFNDDFYMLRILIKVTRQDDFESVSSNIVRVSEASNKSVEMIEWLIKEEIENYNENFQTIFREDNLRIRIISNYFKYTGKHYFHRLFHNIIKTAEKYAKHLNNMNNNGGSGSGNSNNIINNLVNTSLKHIINTHHNNNNNNNVDSSNKISEYARSLTESIVEKLNERNFTCPIAIRKICHFIKEILTEKKGPDYIVCALGNIIFLRWVTPALISPKEYGIYPSSLSTQTKSLLVSTAKYLQVSVNALNNFDKIDDWTTTICNSILCYLTKIPKNIHFSDSNLIINNNHNHNNVLIRVDNNSNNNENVVSNNVVSNDISFNNSNYNSVKLDKLISKDELLLKNDTQSQISECSNQLVNFIASNADIIRDRFLSPRSFQAQLAYRSNSNSSEKQRIKVDCFSDDEEFEFEDEKSIQSPPNSPLAKNSYNNNNNNNNNNIHNSENIKVENENNETPNFHMTMVILEEINDVN